MKEQILIHFILIESNMLISARHCHHAPRAGDEIRLSENKFYLVEKLVWIYDEPENPAQRLNIGLSEIKDALQSKDEQ